MSRPAIVIAGNVIDGHKLYGPFQTPEAASDWASGHLRACEWFWTHLDDPDDVEPHGAGEVDYGAVGASERLELDHRAKRESR